MVHLPLDFHVSMEQSRNLEDSCWIPGIQNTGVTKYEQDNWKKPQGLCRALFGVHEDEIHNRIAMVRLYYPADLISQFISFAVPQEILTDSKPALVITSNKVHKIWGEDK